MTFSGAYPEEIETLPTCNSANYLELNTKKTKEIILYFRKKKQTPQPLVLQNENVERVTYYKYLGVTIIEKLDWSKNTREERAAKTPLYTNSKKLQSGQFYNFSTLRL